ncbi:uncharacterized protein CTRU02_205481 [Colletotrichum truncatum]|uniref:Uncharacterized protein n=1 Tax=Colletotrichum truncatum TaxID=5467 RepID=A0ACC3Z448_COLTU|nr:uncharacterized protein CTRU02_04537 [Colletotrichum truncatum]KAF6795727.1 hypothetical protein CTRU02_04537 [Colletotrichum truncatum]
MHFTNLLPMAAFAGLALASPVKVRNANTTPAPSAGSLLTKDVILKVAPKSASCAGVTDFAEECATADEAVKFLPDALDKYNITSPGEIAGVLSLMALETGEFRFERNHFPKPGRPGQGTRNLQMPKYNLIYARSFPELKEKADDIAGCTTDANTLPDDKKNAILDLVLPDQYSWGSAAWFLATQCDAKTREGLKEGTIRGYTLYMDCIGTALDDDREKYWVAAKQALNVA